MDVTPGYKQTEVGVIPEDWNVHLLASVADVRGGIAKNSSASIVDPVSVNYLRVANVQDGFLDLADVARIDISRRDLGRFSVLVGDVLMNEGGDMDKLGRGALWKGAFSPCVHQNHVFVVRCKATLLPDFLDIWTGSAPARAFFRYAGKQTTNLASISKTSLGELPVALPPLVEQRAIAAALSDADSLLDGLDRLIAKKRDLKQAAMQQLLTGQTRLPGFDGEWHATMLGEIADIVSGGTPRTNEQRYWNGGVKWCTPTDITRNAGKYVSETVRSISVDGLRNSGAAMLPVGTLLLCSRATIGEIKMSAVPLCTNQGFKSLACRAGTSNEFLYYKLLTMKPQMIERAFGSTFLEISTRNVFSLEVAMPTLAEQTAIATVLSDMDAELSALECRRDKSFALKQAMTQELLTGRTRLV